jgi:radical SAM superfamily enzyme
MTKAILLPTSVVAINFEGFSVIFAKAVETSPGCLICSAKRTRLEDTKAISIPEKKAESIKQPKMTSSSFVIIDFYFQIFCDTFCERKTSRMQRLPIYMIYKIAGLYFVCLRWPQW